MPTNRSVKVPSHIEQSFAFPGPPVMKTVITLLVLLLSPAFVQASGIITGKVIDAKTREPLRGVTVRLPGTYYGAYSSPEGVYTVKKIAPGTYTLELSFIGYKKVQKTGIKIGEGDTLTLNFSLEQTDILFDKEIVVIGDKPLVDVEETQSIKNVGRTEIDNMVAEKISDVLVQQTGVVQQNNEIHIRGGRGYEAAYLVDGVSVQDPLAGTGFGLQMSASAVEEVEIITGGFNPEFGQATSGVINIKTREGRDNYEGSAAYRRAWRLYGRNPYDRDTNSSFVTDIGEFSLGGPEPITRDLLPALGITIPGRINFFLNLYGNFSDAITPSFARTEVRSTLIDPVLSPRQDNSLTGLLKLSWIISPSLRLTYSFNQSTGLNRNTRSLQTNLEYTRPGPGYQYEFQNNMDGALTYASLVQLHSFTWLHTLSTSDFYELRVSNFYSRLKVDANGRDFSNYREARDIPTVPATYYQTSDSTKLGIIPGDGFFDFGNGDIWNDHYVDEWNARFDYTNFISEKNRLKTGVDLRFQELQQANIYKPWLGPLGLNNDVFHVNPVIGAVYAQNNISFKGLVLNYGLRFDVWAPGQLVDNAIADQSIPTITEQQRQSYLDGTFSLLGRRWKGRLSPRIGVSHPVTNNQMLFFSYGHFNKLPRPQYVYAKLSPQAASSTYQRFGNPDLDPETTIAYELGLRSQLSTDDILTVTAYYKDIFDYVQTRRAKVNNPRLAGGSFLTYANADYARSRGIEIEYKKRIGDWFRGQASVTYSVVTGKSSSADEGALVEQGVADEIVGETFMSWDRPWQANATANFVVKKDEPLFGLTGLDDINAFIRFFFQSGERYTPDVPVIDPTTGQQQVLPNGKPVYRSDNTNILGEFGTPWWWVDLNIEKYFSFGGLRWTVTLEVINLFDRKNPNILNPVTGEAYEYGDATPVDWNDPLYPQLQSPVDPFPFNPARYLDRRTVRLGTSVRF